MKTWYKRILPLYYKKREKTLYILNQKKLPEKEEYILCKSVEDVARAIKSMQIRGAPSIGIAAAYGIVLGADSPYIALEQISATRPTARNLFWALEEMRKVIDNSSGNLREALEKAAEKLYKEEVNRNLHLAKFGASLIKEGAKILTICNTGALACLGVGTALGAVYYAKEEEKKDVFVYVCETRPLLQGSRLTAWELNKMNIKYKIICDSAAPFIMSKGWVDLVIVGADRVVANGDVANKIGTYSLALAAQYNKIPFYVAAPYSTFDLNLKKGEDIPIEERSEEEITYISDKRITPRRAKVYNPAFDITPASLITGIITDNGIIYPPFNFELFSQIP